MFRTIALMAAILSVAAQTSSSNPQLMTPKLAALSFVRAMEADDMTAFQAVTIGSEDDYTLFEPLLRMVGAAKDLERAAREKYGKAGRVIVRDSPAVELEVHVQESDVSVKGDTAILRHKGEEGADPLTLRHGPTGWKVDLTAIQNRKEMAAAAPSMHRIQQALIDCATDIRAGKYPSAEEAEQAVLKRMHDAASRPISKGK